MDFGEISASGPGGSVTAEADALFAAAVGAFPITPQFSVFGKAGLFFWDASASGASTITDDGTDLFFGVGVGYAFTEQFTARAEFESFDADGDDITMISAGIQFNF